MTLTCLTGGFYSRHDPIKLKVCVKVVVRKEDTIQNLFGWMRSQVRQYAVWLMDAAIANLSELDLDTCGKTGFLFSFSAWMDEISIQTRQIDSAVRILGSGVNIVPKGKIDDWNSF